MFNYVFVRWFVFSILDKSKKALTYLAMVHVEAVIVTYVWTGRLVGSLGAVITILLLSFPTYLLIEKIYEQRNPSQ